MNKNMERGKLLAAFAALAMVICAMAIVIPTDSVDGTPGEIQDDGSITVDDFADIQTVLKNENGQYASVTMMKATKEIDITNDVNLNGLTLDMGTNVLEINNATVSYGEIRGTYGHTFTIALKGTSGLTNVDVEMYADENGMTNYAAILPWSGATVTITGGSISSVLMEGATTYGAVQISANNTSTTLDGVEIIGDGLITMMGNKLTLTEMENVLIQYVGIEATTINSDTLVLNNSIIAQTVLGWDEGNSARVSSVTSDVDITIESDIDLGTVREGDDENTVVTPSIAVSQGAVSMSGGMEGLTVTVDANAELTTQDFTATSIEVAGAYTANGTTSAEVSATDIDAVISGTDYVEYEPAAGFNPYDALAGGETSGAGWSYSNNTLTLTDYNGAKYFYGSDMTTVVLVGNNTITIGADALEAFFDAANRSWFGAIRNGTGALTVQGDGTLSIVIKGDLSATGLSGKNIVGIFSSGNVNINADVTVEIDVSVPEGNTSYGIRSGTDNTGTVTIGADVSVSVPNIDQGTLTIGNGSTVIVDDLTVTTLTSSGAVVVNGSLNYDGTERLFPYNGVNSQIQSGQIYLNGATAAGNVSPISAIDPVEGVIVNTVTDANIQMQAGNDVVIVSIGAFDITGLVGQEGVSATIGTVTGTVSGFVGTIVSDDFQNATINGVSFGTVTGDGMSVTGTVDLDNKYNVLVTGTGITGTVTGNDSATATFSGVSAGTEGITIAAGSVMIGGDVVLGTNSSAATIVGNGELVLTDVEVSGVGTISGTSITIEGDVIIGKDVIISVSGVGNSLTVAEDAVLSGDGTVSIKTGATISVLGTIEDTVNMDMETSVSVGSVETFISALEYYGTITVTTSLIFTEENTNGDDVNVNGKTVVLNDGVKIQIQEGATVNFTGSLVYIDHDAKADFTVAEGATLGIDDSDIYMNVVVDDEATLNLSNNVTDITGASTKLDTVGFGKIINFSNNYNIASQTNLTVYGTINVAEGYTLTVDSNASLEIMESGEMTVAGVLVMNGSLIVSGTADITGTMNVGGTVSGIIANHGTITLDGRATSVDAVVASYAGSTLNVNAIQGSLEVTGATAYAESTREINAGLFAERNLATLTLNGVKGLVVTATEDVVDAVYGSIDDRKAAEVTVALDISGTVTAGTVTAGHYVYYIDVDGNDIAIADVPEAPVTVVGTLNLTANTTLAFEAGEYTITGIINVPADAEIDNNGTITVAGQVNVTGANARAVNAAFGGDINAVYYDITTATSGATPASMTRTYTSLDAAVLVTNADDNTIVAIGEVEVVEGVTVTVPATITLDNNGTIVVNGTLVFNDFDESYEGIESNVDADVRIDADPARTYTSLANAIDMGMTEIALNGQVEITEDLTIPAGVTVTGGDGTGVTVNAVKAENDVTLTVEGALELTDGEGIILNGNDTDEASLVVGGSDGYVYVPVDKYTAITDVTGAHYAKEVSVGSSKVTVCVISTVEHAAVDSVNVLPSENMAFIAIVGQITSGDLTFTAPEDNYLIVAVTDMDAVDPEDAIESALVFGTVTLGTNVVFGSYGGDLTGTIVVGDAEAYVDGVSDVALINLLYTDDETQAESDRMYLSGDLEYGEVTIVTGTVYNGGLSVTNGNYRNTDTEEVVRYTGALTIADGAEYVIADVEIDDSGSEFITTIHEDGKTVIVDGKLSVVGISDIALNGVVINGTMELSENASVNAVSVSVTGTVDVINNEEYKDAVLNVTGTLVVSSQPTILGDAGTGVVNGKVQISPTTGIIKAYPGADLTEADINIVNGESKADAMVFDINGEAYMTVYSVNSSEKIADMLMDEEFNLLGLDVGLNYGQNTGSTGEAVNTGLYQISNWYSEASMLGNTVIGANDLINDYDVIYAHAEAASVTGTISVGTGITLYIDGVPVTSGNNIGLLVGTHTVSYDIHAGYNGDSVTITFNGQTVQSGSTITIGVSDSTYNLAATGAVPSDGSTVVVNNGSDDMSLTDILLIVLVVLIVIMAVIVALRLMRS